MLIITKKVIHWVRLNLNHVKDLKKQRRRSNEGGFDVGENAYEASDFMGFVPVTSYQI